MKLISAAELSFIAVNSVVIVITPVVILLGASQVTLFCPAAASFTSITFSPLTSATDISPSAAVPSPAFKPATVSPLAILPTGISVKSSVKFIGSTGGLVGASVGASVGLKIQDMLL